MVQWLRLSTSYAGGVGSIPGQGTKIPYAAQCGKKKKKSYQLTRSYFPGLGYESKPSDITACLCPTTSPSASVYKALSHALFLQQSQGHHLKGLGVVIKVVVFN